MVPLCHQDNISTEGEGPQVCPAACSYPGTAKQQSGGGHGDREEGALVPQVRKEG